jgi:hypothetical protein
MPRSFEQTKKEEPASGSPEKQQKVLNKKGAPRRFNHKMTMGDSNSEVFAA